MNPKPGIYWLLLALVICSNVFGQNELGNPYIKNYSPKDYNSSATIWDITQDNNGLMYFGAAVGVIQYDGTNWQVIPVSNATTVRALDVDKNGKVYVGAKGEFGYLGEDSLKHPVYVSISENLEEKHKDFADVWNIYVTNEGVFFLTFKRIYRWHNNQLYVYEYDDITAHLGFYVNKKLYLILDDKGIYWFNKDKFEPIPGTENHIGGGIYAILPYDDDHIIVASRKRGLLMHNIQTGKTVPFKNAVNDELIENKIYHGTVSQNGDLIVTTLKDGIYVINKEGKLVMHINQRNGLQNDNVKYIYRDNYGGLWAGTAVGISYIDLDLPLTYFTPENGLHGFLRDVVRYKGKLYVASGNGIFYLDKEERNLNLKFKQMDNADDQFWKFLKVDDHLLIGGSQGLFELKDDKLVRLQYFGANAVFTMLRSKKDPSIIYLALKNGLALAKINGKNEIEVIHKFEEYETESHNLGEDKDGNLWISTAFDFTIKVDQSSFNEENGFPLTIKKIEYGEKLSSEEIIEIDNQLYFTSSNGLLKADENDELKVSSDLKIDDLPEEYGIKRLQKDHNGNLWVHYHYEKESGQIMALKNDKGTYTIKGNPFTRINEKISHTNSPYVEEDGIAWFTGGEGLVRYDFNKDVNKRKDYHVNIRKVTLHADSILSYGNNANLDLDNFTFSFNNNATSFTFSAASYGNEKENKYQYFLEGYDEDWSNWTDRSTKEYNYLPEAKYVFRVRAKNIYNQISKEDQFTFVILPPWYRETWAYIAYGLLFILLVYLIIKLATYRLMKSKRQLEIIVKERTKDITIEKEKVEVQKKELEHIHKELSERNKDVMDSIKYAQNIQTAILPPLEKFKKEFKEAFIFYKPRDIVSGDFYWYERVGDYFIVACADCTGHGVPGAFMSMIGATLLNKIVEKNEIGSCQDALTTLDIELQKALRQHHNDDENISVDGMDIALIAVNIEAGACHYSGAYRPLYVIRNNELVVYNSNRLSIGGGFSKEKEFHGENINIKSGDQLYMFTDGITDQFGGEKNKKFKRDRLKKLLLKNSKESMDVQHQKIEKAFNDWKGENEQIDDVLLLGIQIP